MTRSAFFSSRNSPKCTSPFSKPKLLDCRRLLPTFTCMFWVKLGIKAKRMAKTPAMTGKYQCQLRPILMQASLLMRERKPSLILSFVSGFILFLTFFFFLSLLICLPFPDKRDHWFDKAPVAAFAKQRLQYTNDGRKESESLSRNRRFCLSDHMKKTKRSNRKPTPGPLPSFWGHLHLVPSFCSLFSCLSAFMPLFLLSGSLGSGQLLSSAKVLFGGEQSFLVDGVYYSYSLNLNIGLLIVTLALISAWQGLVFSPAVLFLYVFCFLIKFVYEQDIF